MTLTDWRRAWSDMWHGLADRTRKDWAEYVARWEADTEPGYPMTGWARDRRNLALALADLYDALGGRRL